MEARGVLFFARVLFDLWVGKKTASARCTVFYNGFRTPKVPEVEVGAVLFFCKHFDTVATAAGPAPSRRRTLHPCSGSAICVKNKSFI